MASPAPPRFAANGSHVASGRKKLALMVAVIAIFNKATVNNVLASAGVALVAPAAATAFVYEVSSLRGAQLEHEATDRVDFVRVSTELPPSEGPSPSIGPARLQADIGSKLDGMITSRAKMLDIFGDQPSAVAPIYVRIIKAMLTEDNAMFAVLSDRVDGVDAETLAAKAESLRAVHVRLEHLIGA
jgi:hypothetical protein